MTGGWERLLGTCQRKSCFLVYSHVCSLYIYVVCFLFSYFLIFLLFKITFSSFFSDFEEALHVYLTALCSCYLHDIHITNHLFTTRTFRYTLLHSCICLYVGTYWQQHLTVPKSLKVQIELCSIVSLKVLLWCVCWFVCYLFST